MIIKFKNLLEKMKDSINDRDNLTSYKNKHYPVDIIELFECVPLMVQELTNEISKKASADGILKALSLKANITDVNEGFTKIKTCIDSKQSMFTDSQPSKKPDSGVNLNTFFGAQNSDFVSSKQLTKILAGYISGEEFQEINSKEKEAQMSFNQNVKREIESVLDRISQNNTKTELRFAQFSDSLQSNLEDAVQRENELASRFHSASENQNKILLKNIEQKLSKEFSNLKSGKMEELSKKQNENLNKEILEVKKTVDFCQSDLQAKIDNYFQLSKNNYNAFKSEIIASVSRSASRSNEEVVFQEIYSHINKFQVDLSQLKEHLKVFEQTFDEKIVLSFEANELAKKVRKENSILQKKILEFEKVVMSNSEISKTSEELKAENKETDAKVQFLENNLNLLESKFKNTPKCNEPNSQATKKLLEQFQIESNLKITKLENQFQDLASFLKPKNNTSKSPEPKKTENWKGNIAQKVIDQLQKIKESLAQKPDIKSVCSLLDKKADISAVNDLLQSIHTELDTFPAPYDLSFIATSLKTSVPLLLSKAQWMWKQGQLQEKVIQWDTENYNYLPENFELLKNNCVLGISQEGLYELTFGFFGRTKPVIEVYLNQEMVISTVKLQLNASADKFENGHSNGFVVGIFIRNHFC